MENALILAFGFLAGVVIGFLTGYSIRRQAKTEHRETTKVIIWVCLFMGFAWVWTSYILAWLDKTQIAESLSQAAVTEIVGVVLAYCIKAAVENLSKNNSWPDKAAPEKGPESERKEPEDAGQ